jgi:hypothetical protein
MVAVTGSMREVEMSEIGWSLHPQLAADTVPVCDLALSRLLAMNDANFPWLVLVPRRAGVSEIIDLGIEQALLMDELALVSRALKDETRCDKLNVAAIGNMVPQLLSTSWRGARMTRHGRSRSGVRCRGAPMRPL